MKLINNVNREGGSQQKKVITRNPNEGNTKKTNSQFLARKIPLLNRVQNLPHIFIDKTVRSKLQKTNILEIYDFFFSNNFDILK